MFDTILRKTQLKLDQKMDLLQLITPETTLLTPNRRLSAALIKQHQTLQISLGKTCWLSPDILPFPSWLDRLWQESSAQEIAMTPLLLSANQEQTIWEDILRRSPESETLLQISHTAEIAKSAWSILQEWQVSIDHPAFHGTQDNIAFQSWAQQFEKRCLENNWLSHANLAEKILQKIKSSALTPPKHIILTGFTEMSPLQKSLIQTCTEHGSKIIEYQATPSEHSVHRISLADAEAEIRTMASWAKSLLDLRQAPIFIGCIIPNLEDKRDQVIQIFSDVFSEKNTYTLNYADLPFNISAGKTLIAYPIIHTAFQLLNLHSGKTTLATFSNILRSPFLGEAEKERLSRANFDSRLHSTNQIFIPLKKFDQLSSNCPALAKRLKLYFQEIEETAPLLRCSEWVKVFIELLKILGWPGERHLNSPEYQIIQNCWLPLLSQFAEFDNILPTQNFSSALHYLTRLAATTVFQPQSPEAPIQILGMLEAIELPFDHLWVSGLDDSVWPSPAKPNPFIPYRLQKTLHMPNASPERELNYCRKLTEQLKQSAKNVIFSHAMQTESAELRPSTLIKNIDAMALEQLTLAHTITPAEQVFDTRSIELLQDDQAPQITPDEKICGGTNIFKLQAACPFKAFAELRLHAKKIENTTLGLRPQDRGNIVHKTLELIWQDLKDLETLKSHHPESLNELIHQHSQSAINSVKKENAENARYLTLELNRIKKIIYNWLQLEKSRPHFKVIFREEERTVRVGKIDIKLRVDRIDELENGKSLIIDYKTGKNNQIKSWFDERPDEPQLPLYCILDPENTIAISFAEIHPDSMKIKGISKMELDIAGINVLSEIRYSTASSWDQQIIIWQKNLEKLSDDFFNGYAQVDPKNSEETCRYCHLQSFCRVYDKSAI